jgi:formylglycine-generating enzyme required for sulfatase activity
MVILSGCLWPDLFISPVYAEVTTKPIQKPVITSSAFDKYPFSKRFALVLGNNAYPETRALTNPINDAREITRSLRSLGFNVTMATDLTRQEMQAAVANFSLNLPTGAIGLFYFAGHGVQIGGKNFLLPTDYVETKNLKDFLNSQVDLTKIVEMLSAKTDLTIIILDACRDNARELAIPFKVEEGFTVPSQNSAGVYIAYSTSPGKKAYDGVDGNSPYAKALARNLLMKPGRLEDIFIKTRIEVRNFTEGFEDGAQIPWENGSLSTLFYFTSEPISDRKVTGTTGSLKKTPRPKPKLPGGVGQLKSFSYSVPQLDISGMRVGLQSKNSFYFTENFKSINLEMVEIPGGEFRMGSDFREVELAFEDALRSNDEADREVITAEMPKRSVEVPGFFMGKFEITQAQWQAVMIDLPAMPAEFKGASRPVVNVSWREANEFCDKLSAATGRNYRLPSEAEWEYAARADTETYFPFGANINSNYVNFFAPVPFGKGIKGDFRRRTVEVGELNAANNFGLYDMLGNVWEWCADYWHWDYNGAPADGSIWNEPLKQTSDDEEDPALYRVIRGCSYESVGNTCRSAHRRARPEITGYGSPGLGFRVVLSE